MRTLCPNGKNPDQALREIDEIHGTNFGGPVDELTAGDLRADWHELDTAPQHAMTIDRKRNLAKDALRHGYTIHEAARLFGARPTEIALLFTIDGERAQLVLSAERMLRAGAKSHADIARHLGVRRQNVARLAEMIGVKSEIAERRANGGGDKYTVEELAKIKQLRKDGLSHGEIGAVLGIPRNTVKSYCLRHGITKGRTATEPNPPFGHFES